MPVNSKHPSYVAKIEQWQRCQHSFDGSDAIKNAGTAYLPKLSGQSQNQYDAYKERALWYGATERTAKGFVGAIMRKAPDIVVPAKLEPYLKDITYTGISIQEYMKLSILEVLLTGRLGLFVDRSLDGSRPWLASYTATQIINWAEYDGDLTMVVLEEDIYETDPADKFVLGKVEQWRELTLDPSYAVNLWRKTEGQKEEFTFDTVTPTNKGQALTRLPFVFINPFGLTTACAKPPMLDLVDVNLSHYRTSADLEHARHFLACPTPWVSGMSKDDGPLKLGAEEAWLLEDPQARAGYLEFTGAGLSELRDGLKDKQEMMAILGAMLFSEGPKGVEAAETAKLRKSGETSVAVSIATAVAAGFETALKIMAEWEGCNPEEVSVTLNTDFVETQLDPSKLKELVATWQQGGMSKETLIWNMKEGELLPPDRSVEDEIQLISLEEPTGLEDDDEGEEKGGDI